MTFDSVLFHSHFSSGQVKISDLIWWDAKRGDRLSGGNSLSDGLHNYTWPSPWVPIERGSFSVCPVSFLRQVPSIAASYAELDFLLRNFCDQNRWMKTKQNKVEHHGGMAKKKTKETVKTLANYRAIRRDLGVPSVPTGRIGHQKGYRRCTVLRYALRTRLVGRITHHVELDRSFLNSCRS